jgi:hypothetical protein
MTAEGEAEQHAAAAANRAQHREARGAAEEAYELEALARRSRNEDLRYKTSTRLFRGWYASTLLSVLVLQLIATNGVFLAVGRNWLQYDPVTLRIFIGATVAQVVALVMVIVRHFFPNSARVSFA